MAAFTAGTVVLIHFPFSDLTSVKIRPALVLAKVSTEDLILCQITSNPYSDPSAVKITDKDFTRGTLKIVCYVRPGKLFTCSTDLIRKSIGMLDEKALSDVKAQVISLIRLG